MEYKEGLVEKNNVSIFYRDYGNSDQEPILLVHGLGAQLVHWSDDLIDLLIKNNYRPIVFDNRDAGLSSRFSSKPSMLSGYIRYYLRLPVQSEYDLNDMAKDAINLLDHLKIDKAHILGTSMGGMISQIICAKYPEKIKSFTLIASTASVPGPFNGASKEVREIMIERAQNVNPTAEEVYERELKWVSLIGTEGSMADTQEFKNETFANYNRALNRGNGYDYARQLFAILSSKNRIRKVMSIQSPTLIIHGKDDPLIHYKNSIKINKLIKNSKLLLIDDMRHLIDENILNKFSYELIQHFKKAN
ncbi:MAG: alpha/beta fold hydrolase [Gammaproteobacteria bacterium]